MTAALRAFMSAIVDYAGLFPPARLPLDDAIRRFARYRAGADAWMLSRFVVPAGRVGELLPYCRDLLAQGPPAGLSVITGGARDAGGYREALAAAAEAVDAFARACEGRAEIGAFEVRLPGSASDERGVREALDAARAALGRAPAFFEVPQGAGFEDRLAAAVGALAGARGSGLKLRCGGPRPEDVPPAALVASTVRSCVEGDVPFKATAGLHHPVRHHREPEDVTMHGFLNVFGAGILARSGAIEPSEIAEVVRERDATAFSFDDDGFGWRGRRASVAEIEDARARAVLSFGSCSFDEPRDDLRALGLLPAPSESEESA